MSAARCSGGESTASGYGAMNDASCPGFTTTSGVVLCVAATSAATGVTRDAGVHVVEPVVARDAQHLRRRAGSPCETARVAPHESTFADGDAGATREQTGDEISGEVRAGRPARTPETDVAHDA